MYWSVLVLMAGFGPVDGAIQVAHSTDNSFTSYTKAWHTAKEQKKPMLVILNPANSGDGSGGIVEEQLRANQKIETLLGDYVVAIIDTGTEHGKQVHELFGAKSLPRVVVIDNEQRYQLFGTSGQIPESRLADVLSEFKAGNLTSKSSGQNSNYVPGTVTGSVGGTAPANCPNCQRNWQF